MEKGFEVQKVEPVDSSDPRGRLWEWKLVDGRQITICERKAGTRTGSHFHRGHDKSKKPERLFIARGRVQLTTIIHHNGTKKREKTILEAGDSVKIHPHTTHKLEILEDAIILEYRLSHFDRLKPDTFPVEI